MSSRRWLTAIALCGVAVCSGAVFSVHTHGSEPKDETLSIVIMDPLAAPLSCPCVEGYAQRDYNALAKLFEEELHLKVKITFAASLENGIKKAGGADIIIGKQSVVEHDLSKTKLAAAPRFRLTDMKGETVQRGLIVVNRDDPAKEMKDLAGYTIIFGDASASEKHTAALALLKKSSVTVPKKLRKIDEACSDGACKVIDLGPDSKTAAVISSYAQPLLEGCGTIKKGDLRVVGKTEDVPFVTMFVSDKLNESQLRSLDATLELIPTKPDLLESLESLAGFLKVEPEEDAKADSSTPDSSETKDSNSKKKPSIKIRAK